MADPFIAEIRIFPYNFAPRNWAFCNGQTLPIAQNTALFSLLGVTYGGDGRTTFALPNFSGRAPLNAGQGPGLSNYSLGQMGGTETVTLSSTQLPAHNHSLACAAANANKPLPANNFPSASIPATQPRNAPSLASSPVTMAAGAIASSGGSQPHSNMQPYLGLSFCIALVGIFPARN